MNRIRTIVVCFACLGASLLRAAEADALPAQQKRTTAIDDDEVRRMVEKSLPWIEREAETWLMTKGCNSCHHVTFHVWAQRAALGRGFRLDATRVAEWTNWSRDESLSHAAQYQLTTKRAADSTAKALSAAVVAKLQPTIGRPFFGRADFEAAASKHFTPTEWAEHGAAITAAAEIPKQGAVTDGGGVDTLVQLLLSGAGDRAEGRAGADLRRATWAVLERYREADGRWKANGQLIGLDWPDEHSHRATTYWTGYALACLDEPPAYAEEWIKPIVADLSKPAPDRATGLLVPQLLFASKRGTAGQTKWLRDELVRRQNADGGWSWREGGKSDPLDTGMALLALVRTGLPATDAAVMRGRSFLRDSQADDGSFPTSAQGITHLTSSEARVKRLEPIYRYWGTAWAVLGLLESLPRR